MVATDKRLILASASVSRARLLAGACVPVALEPSGIDEEEVKRVVRDAGASSLDCAVALAAAKASPVSARNPAALVIAADQILVAGPEWYDKPVDLADARGQLQRLRGRTHVLATACCVMCGGVAMWQVTAEPKLTMRDFSDGFLDAYIADEGEELLASVGAYRLEAQGIQLFSRIEGDYFAILGLPLVELLGYLRCCGAIAG